MQESVLARLSKVNQSLLRTNSLRTNLTSLLEELELCFAIKRSFVLLYDDEAEKLVPVAFCGLDIAEFRRLGNNVEKTILTRIFNDEKSFYIEKLSDEKSLGFLANDENKNGLLCVPVILSDKCLGLLAVETGPDTHGEDKHDETVFSLIASMIAQTLRIDYAVAEERQRLLEENTSLKNELKKKYDFSNIIGNSSEIRQVYEQVTQVARSNATVLLRGESGTGKELIAHAIHYNSLRSKKPFVVVNCAALPEALIESELFGYEKGAFTGADKRKIGRFEMADGGTLFLDEIGDLPPQTQVKLLRVLQERKFERLGGTETLAVNVRLITATNKNLENEIADGNFREDLFYRLNVFTIFLPPLRKRKSDILLLAEHFLEKYEIEHNKRVRRISTPAIDMLTCYHFPGNVRELENAIERAVLVCDSNVIHGHHLPPTLQTADVTGTVTDLSLTSAVETFEKDMIRDALKTTKGNVAQASKHLNSTERVIGYKIKKYNINPRDFR
ncbi:MAG: sigma 54-interacting transcriptional regulator [Pyrinomonadaceae bacterium]